MIKKIDKTKKHKLLKLYDCPGCIHFRIYRYEGNDFNSKWHFILHSINTTYGYDPNFKYNFKVPDYRYKNTLLQSTMFDKFNPDREPNHSGFDEYMIFWTLEGEKVKDLNWCTDRVFVLSDDNDFIIDFIKKHQIEKKPYKYFKISIDINEINKERAFDKLTFIYNSLILGEFITFNEHDCGKFSELPYNVCDTGEFEMQLTDEHIKDLESLKK